MTVNILKLISLTVAISVATILAGGCGSSGPETVQIPVDVQGATMDPDTIRVKQHDLVTLKIDSEESGTFHLHGYDIQQSISEDEVADFYFVADATGRFGITFHHFEKSVHEDQDKDGNTSQEVEHRDENNHGAIFMSEGLEPGDSFSFLVSEDFEPRTVPFHSHLHAEVSGSVVVSLDAPMSGTVTIRIKDLSAHPPEVDVRPGTTVIWVNDDSVHHVIVSGHHPDEVHTKQGRKKKDDHETKEQAHDEHGEEEIDLGFLEVRPR